jgi:hypothetical protein
LFSNHWFRRKVHLKLCSFFEFFIVLFWLFTYITLIELQYWSNMRNTISFIIKFILNSQNKIDCVPHLFFFSHQYIHNTSCIHIYFKKVKRSSDLKKSCLDYFTFYNKNVLHYKVKVIFFVISQRYINWFNVSITFFIQIQRPQVTERGKPAQVFCDEGEGV